ncbi:quinoprotein relay system zinc metallohydrolase 2 [Rhodoligotrophos appendicifer]|uniref:quinoprotein relay system zinc metallohydrolase 2 n=1 Tax=Rhodoligotrophos appendicifer TaxID=987056 RepID=UPI001186A965|nr:quinoprotein relay system zinc metallohydrolase 2 [Rhodoligotrophos appendicifer]
MDLSASIHASRRQLLAGGLCFCCLPMLGAAAARSGLHEVAPSVFIRRGLDVDAAAGNRDALANIGFIIGRDAVLVTDSGGSLADGEWLRSEIRRLTDKPIRYVVMSHVHPDHSFGAGAFVADAPEFIGHVMLKPALQARGEFYREKLSDLLGPGSVGPVVMPTREIGAEGGEIDLGDRRLTLHAHSVAHTDSDLSILDPSAGVLLPADLLFVTRVPALDGSLLGWLQELDRLEALEARTIIPGHGPVSVGTSAFADLRRYLVALRDGTRAAIRQGVPIEAAAETVALSEAEHWVLFGDYNRRNVIQAFKELEWE